jgi:hypothetical protein
MNQQAQIKKALFIITIVLGALIAGIAVLLN